MKKQWRWMISTVSFCILAPIAWTAISVEMHFNARDEAAEHGTEFLTALGTHEYAQAYAMLTPEQQRATSPETMQRTEEQIEKKYGKATGQAAVDEYDVSRNNSRVTLLFVSVYPNEPAMVLVRLTRTGEGWQVEHYQYDYDPA